MKEISELTDIDRALESAIIELLSRRATGKTICPSRLLACWILRTGKNSWSQPAGPPVGWQPKEKLSSPSEER